MFKKIILSIATIAATVSLAVSVQASEKVELKVATDSDTAPFTYQKDGKFKGYDVDVVKAVFKGSKYKVTFKTTLFQQVLMQENLIYQLMIFHIIKKEQKNISSQILYPVQIMP